MEESRRCHSHFLGLDVCPSIHVWSSFTFLRWRQLDGSAPSPEYWCEVVHLMLILNSILFLLIILSLFTCHFAMFLAQSLCPYTSMILHIIFLFFSIYLLAYYLIFLYLYILGCLLPTHFTVIPLLNSSVLSRLSCPLSASFLAFSFLFPPQSLRYLEAEEHTGYIVHRPPSLH